MFKRYDVPLSPEAARLEASRNLEYRTQSKDGERFELALALVSKLMTK